MPQAANLVPVHDQETFLLAIRHSRRALLYAPHLVGVAGLQIAIASVAGWAIAIAVTAAGYAAYVVLVMINEPRALQRPVVAVLLDRPHEVLSITYARRWGLDRFRVIVADGSEATLRTHGALSRRLILAFRGNFPNATIDTPWLRQEPRPPPVTPVSMPSSSAPAFRGWPFS